MKDNSIFFDRVVETSLSCALVTCMHGQGCNQLCKVVWNEAISLDYSIVWSVAFITSEHNTHTGVEGGLRDAQPSESQGEKWSKQLNTRADPH